MYIFLKLHIKDLASEARFVRHEANKRKAFSRSVRRRVREVNNLATELMPAAEVALSSYHELHHHRTVTVRQEARAAQLAYAFLRGRTFRQVEPEFGLATCNPKWVRVLEIINQYRDYGDEGKDIARRLLMDWLQEGGLGSKITGWAR